jgi:exodeoxyribonuclease VII large subunit
MTEQDRRIYHVSELTRAIKNALEGTFGDVWVEGELSNLRQPSSGHSYFTIKDETAQIQAVMFRSAQRSLKFKPADGVSVRAFGQVSVYERSGQYQIVVRLMEDAGEGALQAAFEKLKKKLLQEGLFDETRKRPLPLLPRHIGVVTSPTGAAIRDILKVISRRFPNLHVVIAPVKVQGESAAAEIAEAIQLLNQLGGLDVLIVGRGGGSLEDLWCFNEEIVARAIAASTIPVISAVGHEIDFTISDFVADVRAPTPSAAAEQVVGLKESFERHVADLSTALIRTLRQGLLEVKTRLASAQSSYVFTEPRNIARQFKQQMRELELRIQHSVGDRLRQDQQRIDDAGTSISHVIHSSVQLRAHEMHRFQAQLRALNPLAVLDRGYSITHDADGRVLTSVAGLKRGRHVSTRLATGSFESDITDVRKAEDTKP